MTQKEKLQEIQEDLQKTPVQITLEWGDGTHAGISNVRAVGVAMKALREEVKRQINELK